MPRVRSLCVDLTPTGEPGESHAAKVNPWLDEEWTPAHQVGALNGSKTFERKQCLVRQDECLAAIILLGPGDAVGY